MVIANYVDLELEDQILQVKNYLPLHSVLNENSRGIKYFKGVQIYQEFLVQEVQKFEQNWNKLSGVQILRYI